MLLLLLLTVTLNLPLLAAMAMAAQALLDLQKRESAPFLAPVLVSTGEENRYMPAGLWHIQRFASTYRASSSSNERWA
jgi:hypothetical protein